MADYDFRPGGSLKLKGGVAEGGIVKRKKKSKSKSNPQSDSGKDRERERVKELLFKEEAELVNGSPSGSNRDSPALSGNNDRKTDAERRFEEAQRRRLADKVARLARKTHKDRVNELNARLESLSEHHDIPKVGPG
ncbi:carbomoyl phosphate synthetase large subunit [Rhizopogon vesiculosus]|uniref:Carbomoyl phosphate synthetase large subunit n=1 Tax=Rhizopogon vesiculosus TaxID=180088 RepID=A0A1J8R149_9AGAM|nr:carbomoyl phosphate synthetase large subunit [Rhizopogon vesiculosus]